jgi:hypothetical protein
MKMSYKSRQKKRMISAAVASAERKRTPATEGRWFLTIVQRTCCCARCAGMLREGREMVYRYAPRESLCPACAEADPDVKVRTSIRWEQARKRR